MRKVKILAFTLRVIGIVILCLGLVFTIYSVCTTGSRWRDTKLFLDSKGVDTDLFDKMRFDNVYFGALSDVAVGNTVADGNDWGKYFEENYDKWYEIMDRFAYLEEGIPEGEKKVEKEAADKIYSSYGESEFLRKQILEHAATYEDKQDEKELTTLYKSINDACAPKKAVGKAIDYRGQCRAYYDALYAERGEDAGTFVEFSGAILKLYTEYKAGRGVKIIDKYLDEEMSWDEYAAALEDIRREEKIEAEFDPVESFVSLVRENADSKAYADYYDRMYTRYLEFDPDTRITHDRFVVCLHQQLTSRKIDFFGTDEEIRNAVEDEISLHDRMDFNSYNQFFSMEVLRDAYNRKEVRFNHRFAYIHWDHIDSVGDIFKNILNLIGDVILFVPRAINNICIDCDLNIPAVLWKQAELTWLFWTVGAALVLISIAISVCLNRYILKCCNVKKSTDEEDSDVLLRVEHLKQYFRSKGYVNKAVDDISFFIKKGEVFGLVGESGCGKTTTGRTIINLYDPTDGDVYFKGHRISTTEKGLTTLLKQLKNEYKQRRTLLRRQLKQGTADGDVNAKELYREKMAELNKKYDQDTASAYIHTMESRIEKKNSTRMYREKLVSDLTKQYNTEISQMRDPGQIAERKAVYRQQIRHAKKENIMTKMQMIFQDPIASINPRMTVREIIAEGLKIRGIRDSKYINRKVVEMLELVGLVPEHMDRYPHEFSGGQRQRIGIARAVIMEPELIIADEPISALDVSIQAQVLNLLNELRENMGLTILFIAHNLSVVKFFSDRIAVMYYGKIVEMTTSDELFAHPLHPYTKSLLSAIPYPDPEYEKNRKRITYNPAAVHDYSVDKPELREITPGHFIYCNEPEFKKYRDELGIR